MRKFRNAALAAATATAVAFGGTVVADAQTVNETTGNSSTFTSGSSKRESDGDNFAKPGEWSSLANEGEGSSELGNKTGAENRVDLTNLFGKRVNDDENAQWARIWRDAMNWFGLLTGIGIIIGIGNWALHEGLLPQIPFNF